MPRPTCEVSFRFVSVALEPSFVCSIFSQAYESSSVLT